jgi:hypothetical protein
VFNKRLKEPQTITKLRRLQAITWSCGPLPVSPFLPLFLLAAFPGRKYGEWKEWEGRRERKARNGAPVEEWKEVNSKSRWLGLIRVHQSNTNNTSRLFSCLNFISFLDMITQRVSAYTGLVSGSKDNALSPAISGTGLSYDSVVRVCRLAVFSHSVIAPQPPDFAFACALHPFLTAVVCHMHATSDSLAHPVARLHYSNGCLRPAKNKPRPTPPIAVCYMSNHRTKIKHLGKRHARCAVCCILAHRMWPGWQ